MLTSLFEPVMVVFMTAGDSAKWRGTPAGERRLLLGRRLAQVHFADALLWLVIRGCCSCLLNLESWWYLGGNCGIWSGIASSRNRFCA